jgi:CBS domain containing-hemolysin-like protein
MMADGHTRYPVIDTPSEDLLGVIHLHDLLEDTRAGTARTVCRPAVVVPTTLPLTKVLAQLTSAKEEMALVIDEYGGFAGVLTVEDMAEELVGEIADEHDPEDDDIVCLPDGWLLRGDVHLDEVARSLGHDIPEGAYETLAGLVIAEFGGLPAAGDAVDIPLDPRPADLAHGLTPVRRVLRAEVRAVENRVPSSVFVAVLDDTGTDGEAPK